MRNPSSRRRSPQVHARLLRLRDAFYPELTGQPPSAEWIGPMGFTPDQLPAIGFLRPGVIVAAGFNGYGGSYTTAAGQAAAVMALTGHTPDWVPEDVFSPRRFLEGEPLFMRAHESLWRIAASLCRQLRAVEAQTAEGLAYTTPGPRVQAIPAASAGRGPHAAALAPSAPRPELDAQQLRRFATFRQFSLDELTELVRLMRRWEAVEGTLLFPEGSAGGSCFVVLSGTVEVSTMLGDQPHRLASLGAGSIFGQVSLIDGQPRSASCSMRHAGVLLEMEQGPCARLFAARSSTALQFLAAVNQGLIAALRGADRRLMRLQADSKAELVSDVIRITDAIPA
jgi:CRP-like cAMP-binding protein